MLFAHRNRDLAMKTAGKFGFDKRSIVAAILLGPALAGCGKSSAPPEGGDIAKVAAAKGIEKSTLKLGFIKLTDMAPLAVAKEKGFFAEEGLNVRLEPQANWKVLHDGVAGGQLDGAHMLAGQPIAAAAGIGAKVKLVAPLSLDLNGNAITVSNKVWDKIAPGLLFLAQRTGAGIVPVEIQISSFWRVGRKWDALWIPKPFSKITLTYHAPLTIAAGDGEAARLDAAMGPKG